MEKTQPKMAAVAKARVAAAAAAATGIGADRDGLLNVGVDGLQCSCGAGAAWAGGRGGLGVSAGTYYFEVTQLSEGLCRIGWSALSAKLALGTDTFGFGFGGTGKKSHGGKFTDYGEAYGRGDTVGCLIDRAAKTISYFKNGTPLGEAFEVPASLAKHALFPAICIKGSTVRLNMGTSPFVSRLPAGATALCNVEPAHAASNSDGGASSASVSGKPPASDGRAPLALVLEPARDLAEQVHECIVDFSRHFTEPRLTAALLVGGVGAEGSKLLRQGVDIVSGTPGRVEAEVKQGKLSLSEVQFFVLDEADRLLDTGNLDTILKLHAKAPKVGRTGARLQTLLFSATLHTPEVRALAEKITVRPTFVDLKGKEHVPETVHHVVVHVDPETDTSWSAEGGAKLTTDGVHRQDKWGKGVGSAESWSEGVKRLKPQMLLRIVERLKMTQCLIFCRTNLDCDNLEAFLNAAGGGRAFRGKAEKGVENKYSCVVLAGMRSMDERRRNLAAFKEGDVRFMVCTDVAARGLDIKELPFVINMTLPDKEEDYVHRVGRVGRADVMGLAVSLVATKHKEKVWFYDKRKWPDPTKLSTKLASNGGCCIWYDEPALYAGIQKRLGTQIEALDAFLVRLPGGIGSLGATMGQAKDGGLNAATSDRLSVLAPRVSELADLEIVAQRSFILGVIHRVWGGGDDDPEMTPVTHESTAASGAASGGATSLLPVPSKRTNEQSEMGIGDEEAGPLAHGQTGGGKGRGGGGARGSGRRRHRGRSRAGGEA
jgi:ATP-dependent RNA helicase DDX1